MSVIIITNLYPDEVAPYFGTFVADSLVFFGREAKVVYPGNAIRHRKLYFYLMLYRDSAKAIRHAKRVVFHYPLFFFPLILLARILGKEPVLVYHGGEFMERPREGALLKILKRILFFANNRLAKVIMVPTAYVADNYFRSVKEKIIVWYSGGILVPPQRELRQCFDFAFFGRRESVKGFDCFMRAVAALSSDETLTRYKMTGLVVCRESPAREIENIGSFRILHSPPLAPLKLFRAIERARFVVVPSRNESLCLLALEAAVRGAVVIARRLPAIEETLSDSALYFEDDHELVGVLKHALLMSEEERRAMSLRSRQFAARFDRRRVLEDVRL